VQVVVIPIIFTIVGLLGIFTAAAAETAYGEPEVSFFRPNRIKSLELKLTHTAVEPDQE
jgi:hypothetical protein